MSSGGIRFTFNKEALLADQERLEVFYAGLKDHGPEGIGRIPDSNHIKEGDARMRQKDINKLDQLLMLLSESEFLQHQLKQLQYQIQAAEQLSELIEAGSLDRSDPYHQYLASVAGLEWDRMESEGVPYVAEKLDELFGKQELLCTRLFEAGEDVAEIESGIRLEVSDHFQRVRESDLLLDKVLSELDETGRGQLKGKSSLSGQEQELYKEVVSSPNPFDSGF